MALRIIRVIIYCLPVVLLGWIIYLNFLPLNNLSLVCRPWYCSPRVKLEFAGLDKNLWPNEFSNLKESFYFDLALPKNYDFKQAEIELALADQLSEIDYFNFGNLIEQEIYSRKNLIFSLPELDSASWDKIEEEELILYQRPGALSFKKIDDFLENIPSLDQIAQYNFNLSEYFKVPGYQPENKFTEIDQELIGPHNFILYLKDEPLFINFNFDPQTLNRQDSGQISVFKISDSKKLISEKYLSSLPAEEKIQIDSLPAGAYLVSLEIPATAVVQRIKTKQHWFMIEGEENDPANLFIPPYQAIHNPGGFPVDLESQETINYVIINNHLEDSQVQETRQGLTLTSVFSREELALAGGQTIRFIIESNPGLAIKKIKVSFN